MPELTGRQQEILKLTIQDGLPLTAQPYQTLATALNVNEEQVLNTIQHWTDTGLIKRFGLVVNHQKGKNIVDKLVR